MFELTHASLDQPFVQRERTVQREPDAVVDHAYERRGKEKMPPLHVSMIARSPHEQVADRGELALEEGRGLSMSVSVRRSEELREDEPREDPVLQRKPEARG